MSFLRHARSIGPMWGLTSCQAQPTCRLPLVGTGNQHKGATEIAPLLIVRDESHRLSLGGLVSTRARLRFAGCVQFAMKEYGRSRIFQRTASSVLTICVSRGDKPTEAPSWFAYRLERRICHASASVLAPPLHPRLPRQRRTSRKLFDGFRMSVTPLPQTESRQFRASETKKEPGCCWWMITRICAIT